MATVSLKGQPPGIDARCHNRELQQQMFVSAKFTLVAVKSDLQIAVLQRQLHLYRIAEWKAGLQ